MREAKGGSMKRAINFVLVLFVVATASMAAAKTKEVTAQATGFGDTPETAVANALVEAARQSLGVSVLLDPNFRTESYQWVESEKMVSGSWTSKPEAQAPSLANVVGYKVISTKEIKTSFGRRILKRACCRMPLLDLIKVTCQRSLLRPCVPTKQATMWAERCQAISLLSICIEN